MRIILMFILFAISIASNANSNDTVVYRQIIIEDYRSQIISISDKEGKIIETFLAPIEVSIDDHRLVTLMVDTLKLKFKIINEKNFSIGNRLRVFELSDSEKVVKLLIISSTE